MSTYTYWKKLKQTEIQQHVFAALDQNVNYREQNILGIPASHLDDKVFSQDEAFLKNAPFISTMVQNPNHIGCHTLGHSEPFFAGTQQIEKDVIDICAVDILKAEPDTCDGYIASGGTEANIQAIWIYRNYYQTEMGAQNNEISIICSADSHYSMDKAANLLGIQIHKVALDTAVRSITAHTIKDAISTAKNNGAKYFIVVANMMTTMYGSVDDIDAYTAILAETNSPFKLHVDGAYGGFYFPFSTEHNKLNFANEHVSSVTLDAHKMAQAPYGTGIFLARKGLIAYANTKAGYVEGEDYTLIGSRSGANAVAVWMILVTNGPFGWFEKVYILQKRTEWMCQKLKEHGLKYYRNAYANIITLHAEGVSPEVAHKYGLVPDKHANPSWYKIVIMEHVTLEKLHMLLAEFENAV
ncbi:pyridoxal-dependent decarboxylase [Bacteroidia bacterium]|nr:pyridoxal-dependent decarboxylase [Bacteroidia bacterium]MDB9881814.1 pyridoxal-dependent decarboxylase [Bacteroidia bacterium]MDC1395009.1 pyridoxal-dependent decarboxylase [Bacteroidia bacterium]